ncbi:upstream stimulatory factor 2 isoform X6 [Taeniopygia guttata]|uniref:upstream stimulatory factor 2 isoform X6 n=1 Tax=Taeniopygia guttata TaxID=59729 RepID=UPI003BB88854
MDMLDPGLDSAAASAAPSQEKPQEAEEGAELQEGEAPPAEGAVAVAAVPGPPGGFAEGGLQYQFRSESNGGQVTYRVVQVTEAPLDAPEAAAVGVVSSFAGTPQEAGGAAGAAGRATASAAQRGGAAAPGQDQQLDRAALQDHPRLRRRQRQIRGEQGRDPVQGVRLRAGASPEQPAPAGDLQRGRAAADGQRPIAAAGGGAEKRERRAQGAAAAAGPGRDPRGDPAVTAAPPPPPGTPPPPRPSPTPRL